MPADGRRPLGVTRARFDWFRDRFYLAAGIAGLPVLAASVVRPPDRCDCSAHWWGTGRPTRSRRRDRLFGSAGLIAHVTSVLAMLAGLLVIYPRSHLA